MRLKIEVAGSPLGDTGKDWSRDEPSIVQFRFAGVCIIEHDQTDKLRRLGGQIAGERNDVLSLFVPASRIDLLCCSCLSGNNKTWHSRSSSCAVIADHSSKRVANFAGGFRRNDLAQHHWGE